MYTETFILNFYKQGLLFMACQISITPSSLNKLLFQKLFLEVKIKRTFIIKYLDLQFYANFSELCKSEKIIYKLIN